MDPYGKHRQTGTNKYMREKEVVVTPWEIKIVHRPKVGDSLLQEGLPDIPRENLNQTMKLNTSKANQSGGLKSQLKKTFSFGGYLSNDKDA